jgi:para-aminobenzoate synthetase component I
MSPTFGPPLHRPLDLADPLLAPRALAGLPYPFLLHTALPESGAGWSFFGADPFAVYRGRDYEGAADAWRRMARRAGDALAQVAATSPAADEAQGVPFTGGLVGYWAYDFGRRLERIPAVARDDLGLPHFVLGLYDVVGAFDHATRRAWAFSSGLPLEGGEGRARAGARLEDFARRMESKAGAALATRTPGIPAARAHAGTGGLAVSTFTPDDYRCAVERVREHIRRGDIFQANLSQRWTLEPALAPLLAPGRGDAHAAGLRRADPGVAQADAALALFEGLARRSPAPYAAFLHAGDHAVASASPERFLTLRGRSVVTRPIKGTRPRGASPAEDRALRDALVASEKDRAENVMIVDVLRNDLGRVCETGSVAAPALCEIETFPQVHHLTSTVTGTLRPGLDALDLLHAAFPGGSITGAPKIRAMEVIDALEPVRRHVYTGSLGYLDWRGNADWSIAIRTALVTPRAIHFAAGGGITADSDPDAEYRETLDKAEGIRLALDDLLGPVALEPAALPAR